MPGFGTGFFFCQYLVKIFRRGSTPLPTLPEGRRRSLMLSVVENEEVEVDETMEVMESLDDNDAPRVLLLLLLL